MGDNEGNAGVTGEFITRNDIGRIRSEAPFIEYGWRKSLVVEVLSVSEIESYRKGPSTSKLIL